jgi:RimJ/RimL family protein N-acetyltransferase
MDMTTMMGEKIVLRPYQESDAEPLYQATANFVLRRLTGTQRTFTLAQIQQYLAELAKSDTRRGFIIALPETLAPVGEVVLMNIDSVNRNASIRISLFSEADFSKGYGSEAMRLMVNYGFAELNLHRIELDVFAFNTRAIRVYENIGFKREGLLRDTLFYDGEFHDTVLMSILEDDWLGL